MKFIGVKNGIPWNAVLASAYLRRGFNLLMKWVQQVNQWITRLSVFILILLCVVGTAQVFFRYVLNNSLTWSEELLRYLFITVTFLGAAIGIKERIHIRIDLITTVLGSKARRYYQLFIHSIVLVFIITLFVQGINISRRAFENNLTSSAMGLPLEIIYSVVSIGALVMLVNQIFVMVQDFKTNELENHPSDMKKE